MNSPKWYDAYEVKPKRKFKLDNDTINIIGIVSGIIIMLALIIFL